MHSLNMWVSNTIRMHPYNKLLWSSGRTTFSLVGCLRSVRYSIHARAPRESRWVLSLYGITSVYSHILYPNVESHSVYLCLKSLRDLCRLRSIKLLLWTNRERCDSEKGLLLYKCEILHRNKIKTKMYPLVRKK